ncbi:hypothetical protein GVN24_33675 [Rhizobium sp. CRIBSB]|nr:hypothetical protein [Rhizobium sp. CRIBSB]
MCDFARKRFDSRILDREDNGPAFERFVDEFLRLDLPGEDLVRGLARGPDGAIDISDARQKIKRIVECKFIGADTASTAADRWSDVRQHLENNLLPLALGDQSRRKKYRPWLRTEGELKTYTFVTSSICSSADERDQLRKSISDFFVQCSQKHQELSHLAHVEIDLRYWDDIVGKNAHFAPLFYRWFGGFPQGYSEIALSFGSEGGFKQFLASRNLPYFSRDTYMAEAGQKPVSQFDSILQFLTQGNDARAQIICGPGGVGKTRLSIELCEGARAAGWWPIRLDRKAHVSELDSICQSHADTAKILVFIDYAEAFVELDQVSEAVARLASDGRHRLAILASTRLSSLQQVTDRLIDLHPETTDLSQRIAQDGYADWVVGKITNNFGIPQPDEIARTCKGLPVMAAFAGFLFEKDRAQFTRQFGNLASVKDFSGWASVRLRALEERFKAQPVQSLLADLVVRLPMPKPEVDAFRAGDSLRRDVFDILKADRWIEAEGEAYSAAHDVLADAILARHLSAMPGAEQDRVQDLGLAALNEDRLDRFIAALDRLGDHPVFEKLSGKALVEVLIEGDHEKTLVMLPTLIKSRLLRPSEFIALLASFDVLRIRLAEAPETHLTLARVGEWAATKGRRAIDRGTAERALNAPLGAAVAFQHPSNLVLRCAHAFDPKRFHDDVIKELRAAPLALNSHYLIVSLLKWGTQPDEVLPYMGSWLAGNRTALKASFVYKAWLDANGDVEAVRENLLQWLAVHGTTPEAQFVYKAWLDARGEVDAVRKELLAWVTEHGATPEARFAYQAWLDAGGEVDTVCEKLLDWVTRHGTTPEASHVYPVWLDATGEVNAVREQLLLWLAEHGTTPEAQFVYKAWLDAKGEADAVRERLLLWLAEHGTTPEAQFVYKAWLDAKGEADAVREKLVLWVAEHGTTPEARFVYQAWLEARRPLEPIETACEAWLLEHWRSEDAVYLTKELSKAAVNLSHKSVACILAWAGTYSGHEDAIFRLSRMSRVFHRYAPSPSFSLLVTKVTTEVVTHLFAMQRISKGVRDACSILFANFAKSEYPHDRNWPIIIDMYCNCLRHGSVFWHFKGMPVATWEVLLHEALSLEMLDPITDAAAIRHAHELIQGVRSPDQYAALISEGYLSPLPRAASAL